MTKKTAIIDVLKAQIASQTSFPVLNPDAARLQNELVKADPDLSTIKRLIQTDLTLTGEILKVANSPYYKGLGEVVTIKEAVLRLGRVELVNIIMQVMLKKHFASNIPMVRKLQRHLWDHSVACAFATRWLARYLKLEEFLPRAFIAGLLHDIGKLCLLSAIENVMKSDQDAIPLTPDLVEKILASLHSRQGHALLVQWHLPDQYCRIARDHHAPDYDESDTLVVLVRLADMVCHKLERNNPEEDLLYVMGSREADLLGIRETGIALLEIAMEDAGLVPAPGAPPSRAR